MSQQRHGCRAEPQLTASRGAQTAKAANRPRWHAACWVLCAMALSTACVLPPPIDEQAAGANRAPFIDPTLPNRNGAPVLLRCDGVDTVFSAIISDDDLRDTLYYRFFVDYFRAQEDDLLAIDPTPVTPTSNGRVRTATGEFNINEPILLERPTDPHVVELFVTDREFDDANTGDSNAIAKVPIEGGLTASYQWTVYPIECN